MNYVFYKILHLTSLFLLSLSLGATFVMKNPPKWPRIVTGISSFLVLVGGMGLIKNIGLTMRDFGNLPLWLHLKMGIWVLVGMLGAILGKRLIAGRGVALMSFYGLLLLASMFVILRVESLSEMFAIFSMSHYR